MKKITLVTLTAITLTLAGCASTPKPAAESSTAADTLKGSITVFATASLKAAFTNLTAQFEEEHPGTTVEFSFAGSSNLVT